MSRAFLLSIISLTLHGAASPQTEQGVAPEWEIRAALQDLKQQTERLVPLLEQVDPAAWSDRSAPAEYAAQWKALTNEVGYLGLTVTQLSAEPENLAKSIEAFLRLLSVEEMMSSFLDGVRRYHNPAIADLLVGILNESGNSRSGFRTYLLELASLKEAELKISNQELQRCRSEMLQRPGGGGR